MKYLMAMAASIWVVIPANAEEVGVGVGVGQPGPGVTVARNVATAAIADAP